MPFYSFKCPKCNVTADELVRMGTGSTVCKTCGTETEKQPSFKTVALGLPNGFASTRSKSRK
jgi:putative FmdB family regulatory protein